MSNNQDKSKPQGEATLCSKEVLAAFGDRLLNELMQGEWEPDFEWQENMLNLAQEMGLIRARPVLPDDDISEEYDFLWERVNAANSAELRHGGKTKSEQNESERTSKSESAVVSSERVGPRLEPHSPKWEQHANAIARGYCPVIKPCRDCQMPVVSGYCCTYCHSTNP